MSGLRPPISTCILGHLFPAVPDYHPRFRLLETGRPDPVRIRQSRYLRRFL
jgi:hypothetical protein